MKAIRINGEIYQRLEREARKRGMSPDALAEELLRAALARLERD